MAKVYLIQNKETREVIVWEGTLKDFIGAHVFLLGKYRDGMRRALANTKDRDSYYKGWKVLFYGIENSYIDEIENKGVEVKLISENKNYFVTSNGEIHSIRNRKELKPFSNQRGKGYLKVKLCQDGNERSLYVHRLVAQAFIPNTEFKLEVNHIDEDPSNNNIENLEWVTHLENSNHGTKNERHSKALMKPKEYYSTKSTTRKNFKKTCEKQGWDFEDFAEEWKGEKEWSNKKYFYHFKGEQDEWEQVAEDYEKEKQDENEPMDVDIIRKANGWDKELYDNTKKQMIKDYKENTPKVLEFMKLPKDIEMIKLKNEWEEIKGQLETVKPTLVCNGIELKKTERNVLVVGDLHLPFALKNALKFAKQVYHENDITDVIFIGDIVDNHYTGYHETDPDGYSANDELRYAQIEVQKWAKAFPNAKLVLGNHDRLPNRKAFTSGISKKWIKTIDEVLGIPWEVRNSFTIGNFYFVHGDKKSAKGKAIDLSMSVVQGHAHSKFGCNIVSANKKNTTFAIQVGCLIDHNSFAMAYGEGSSSMARGLCVIKDIEGDVEIKMIPIPIDMLED